jgi:hypothetical protein
MNANELRIGNYVYDDSGEIVQVEQINSDKIHKWITVSKGGLIYSSNIYPIPLTKEWFLKLGLLPVWYGYEDIEHREFEISTENEGVYRLSVNSNEYVIGEPIEFVHQLQNLYFALTGEELEIKL